MGVTSAGYDLTVGEQEWATYTDVLGAPTGVISGFECTVEAGSTITLRGGSAFGFGVKDTIDTDTVINHEQPANGSRFDVVVLTRDWATNTTTVRLVQGGPTRVVPPLRQEPGVWHDQPLYLIQVTAGAAPVLSDDLRVTVGGVGAVWDKAAMTGPPGTRYVLEPSGLPFVVADDGFVVREWEPPTQVVPPVPVVASGRAAVTFNASGAAVITHNLGWVPDVMIFKPGLAASSGQVVVATSIAAAAVTATTATIVAKVATAAGSEPYVGVLSVVQWFAGVRRSGAPATGGGEPITDPVPGTPPATGSPSDTVPVDTGAAPASQTPLPLSPPVYTVPKPTASSVGTILAYAAAEIGTTESPAGSNRVKYWVAEKPSWNGGYWCAAFACWVYRKAGIAVEKVLNPADNNPYLCSNLEAAAKSKGLWYTGTPRPGDMALYGDAKNDHAVHGEIVEKWLADLGRVQTIGGNTSDGLSGSPNNGGGVYRNRRNPKSASLPIRGYIRMPTLVPSALQVSGPFPLPSGHYFGVADATTTLDHNGVADNAQGVSQIQAEVGATIDGVYGAATEALVRKWQAAQFRTQTGRVYAADWDVFRGSYTAPAAPTGVVGSPVDGGIRVVFNTSDGAQQYTVTASTGQQVTGTSSPLTVTGLTPGVPVTARVAAANVGGASAQSAPTAVVYPTEGGLSTVYATDSVFPVAKGSSAYPSSMLGAVTTQATTQATADAFYTRLPASRVTAALQQAARNVCSVLYGTVGTPTPIPSVVLKFTSTAVIAQTFTASKTIEVGAKAAAAAGVASWLTHEIAHLYQVSHPAYGTDPHITGLTEGIADYTLIRLGYHTASANRPAGGGSRWYDGYDTTGFFLDWIETGAAKPTPDFVRKLNQALKSTTFTAADITALNAGGRTVDQLWADYKTSLGSPVSPSATLPFTDRENVSFTGAGQTSRIHTYAAGRTTNAGLVVWLHGDAAYEFNNPSSTYVMGGTAGIRKVCADRGFVLVSALAPDTTGTVTWWEDGATKADYVRALVDAMTTGYGTRPGRVVVAGFSGGAQQIGQYLMPKHPSLFPDGGLAVMIGGGGDKPAITAPTWPASTRSGVAMHWAAGETDVAANAPDGFDGRAAATNGEAYYRGAGFTRTSLQIVSGVGHDITPQFGPVLAAQLDKHLPA